MSSAFAPEAYADDADEMARLIAGEPIETSDEDEAIRPDAADVGWRWRVAGVFVALAAFSAAVLTIR